MVLYIQSYPKVIHYNLIIMISSSITGDIAEENRKGKSILTRVHSECFTGNTLGSLRCDCGEQLDLSMYAVAENQCGIIIYVGGHEGRGIGLINKVKAYNLQDEEQLDTYEANHRLGAYITLSHIDLTTTTGFAKDLREYDSVKAVLDCLGVKKLNLMTNNKWKYQAFNGMIDKITPLVGQTTTHNSKYLEAKRKEHGSFAERETNSPAYVPKAFHQANEQPKII